MGSAEIRRRFLKFIKRTDIDPKTVDDTYFFELVESRGKPELLPDEIIAENLSPENQALPVKTFEIPLTQTSLEPESDPHFKDDAEHFLEENPKLKKTIIKNKYDAVLQYTSEHKLELTIGFFATAAAAAAGYFFIRQRGKRPKKILLEERKLE